jgi:ribonuclease HI
MMSRLTIYTDGSCRPTNPGPGGWGYIAIFPDCELHINGGSKRTTNNIMEITAIIEALQQLDFAKKLLIYSDSLYVINCAQGKWQRKKNKELWKKYDIYAAGKDIIFKWVKAHNGDYYNELVDILAKQGVVR